MWMSKSSTFHVLEDEHEHEPDFGFIVAGHHHVVNCMVVFPFFLKKKNTMIAFLLVSLMCTQHWAARAGASALGGSSQGEPYYYCISSEAEEARLGV